MNLCPRFWIWLPDHVTVSGPAGFASILIDSVDNRACLSVQHRLSVYFLWASYSLRTIFLPKIPQMNHLLEPGIAKGQRTWINVWLTEDGWSGSSEGWYCGSHGGWYCDWECREGGQRSWWRKPGSFLPSSFTRGLKRLSYHSPGERVTDPQICNSEPHLSGLCLAVSSCSENRKFDN